MHPVLNSRLAVVNSLGLSDFVLVVNRNMVDTACMNVKILSQILAGHDRTLNVPSGITHSPWAGPLHNVFLGSLLPQGKICGVSLLHVYVHSGSGLLVLQINTGQLAIVGELGNIIVNAVRSLVSIAQFHQFADKVNHFLNVVCSFGSNFRHVNVQSGAIGHKCLCIEGGNLPGSLALAACPLLHLVLACISV